MSDSNPKPTPRLKDRLEAICAEMIERGILFSEASAQFEKCFIGLVLAKNGGNLVRASEELEIHRNTLSKKITQYKIRKSRGTAS